MAKTDDGFFTTELADGGFLKAIVVRQKAHLLVFSGYELVADYYLSFAQLIALKEQLSHFQPPPARSEASITTENRI